MVKKRTINAFKKLWQQGKILDGQLSEGTAVDSLTITIADDLSKDMENRSKGGSKSSRKQGILLATIKLREENPLFKPKQLWKLFPDIDHPMQIEDYKIYKEEDLLYQINGNNKDNPISFDTFRINYFSQTK